MSVSYNINNIWGLEQWCATLSQNVHLERCNVWMGQYINLENKNPQNHTDTHRQYNSWSKTILKNIHNEKYGLTLQHILLCFTRTVCSWFLLVYVCFTHLPLHVHPHAIHHVLVRNVTSLQWKLSPQQAVLSGGGLCSSLIILHTQTTTAQEPWRLLGKKKAVWVPIAGDPNGGWGLVQRSGARMLGPCRSYGVCGSTWTHAYQKAGALVSRSHHHQQQQSINEYEKTFMNILLSVIFFFKLPYSYTFFPFPALHISFLPFSNLPFAVSGFIFFSLCLSLLLSCFLRWVLYHNG